MQNGNISDEKRGLVHHPHDKDNIVFISVVSAEQELEKGYICSSSTKGLLVEEVHMDLVDVIANSSVVEYVALVKMKAQYIKSLTFTIVGGRNQEEEIMFDVNLNFAD